METSERYEPLSPTEIAALKRKSRSSNTALIIMGIMFIGLIGWALWRASWVSTFTALIGALIVLWFVAREQFQSVQSLNRDIREGKKKIVVDRMESQRQDIQATGNNGDVVDDALGTSGPSMSYAYLLKVRGKEFKVSESQYYQCKPGQLVEIYLAPHSEHVFYVNVLMDEVTESATV